jgi:hypothetical protein
VLRSDDGQVTCSILDATPHLIGASGFFKFRYYLAGRHRLHLKGVFLRTELSDGRYIVTNTDADFVREDLPPEVLKETVPRRTSMSELLKRHRERVRVAAGQPRATVVAIGTVEEFGHSFRRYRRMMRAFRERVGYAFTQEEQRDFTKQESVFAKGTAKTVLDAMRTLEDDGKKRAS